MPALEQMIGGHTIANGPETTDDSVEKRSKSSDE